MSPTGCTATTAVNPGSTLLGPVVGPSLDDGVVVTVRCRAQGAHDEHWGTVQPFPGFADRIVRWQDPPPVTVDPQPIQVTLHKRGIVQNPDGTHLVGFSTADRLVDERTPTLVMTPVLWAELGQPRKLHVTLDPRDPS